MDDSVYLFLLKQLQHRLEVANVHLDKLVVRFALNIPEILKVSGVCEFVKVDYLILRVLVDKQAHHVTTNKSGTTSY